MVTTGKGGLGGNCLPTPSEKPVESKEIKITTVLFTEWSKGSSLQRTRLAPILGFKVRVTERRGTELSSLLSSKDLWRGQHCGRGLCVTCRQREGESKQPCKMRNVVYKS